MTTYYDFQGQLTWSAGVLANSKIEDVLKAHIPRCYAIEKATTEQDKSGTDYWALRHDLPALSIDCKVRQEDWSVKPEPWRADDLALETWSVVGESEWAGKAGWTRDPSKRTDYICWFWQDTGRFCIVPFPPLCAVFQWFWEAWRMRYDEHTQNSGRWRSECVMVPRAVVFDALMDWMDGTAH